MTYNSLNRKKDFWKRFINFSFSMFLVVLFVTSCNNNIITTVEGSLVVAVPGGRAVSADVKSYRVDITGTEEKTQTVQAGGVVTFSDVKPGSYTITVSGLDTAGKTIFTGTTKTTVEAGKTASVTITLKVESITITFESNGETVAEQTLAYGTELPTPDETTGYTFEGWNTKSDGTGETVTTTDALTPDSTGKVTIYAQWNPIISGVLMLNATTDEYDFSTYTGSLAPYGSYSSSSATLSLGSSPVYCFDDAGNIYVQESSDTEDGSTNYVVKKYLYQDYEQSETIDISTNDVGGFNFLAYDNAKDTLYGFGPDSGLLCCKNGLNTFTEIYLDENKESSTGLSDVKALAAHDDKVYLFHIELSESKEELYTLSRYPISSSTDGILVLGTATSQTIALNESLGSDLECQMIFQDGALYLLLRNWMFSNNFYHPGDSSVPVVDNYSLGALVKIDPDTLFINESFGTEGYLGLTSNSTQTWGEVEGTSSTSTGTSTETGTVSFTGSSADQEQTHFYGPVGFVAVMPKKLVIADSGFILTNDKGFKLAKKSRIVTVDLETAAGSFETIIDVENNNFGATYDLSQTTDSYYSYITDETETAQ